MSLQREEDSANWFGPSGATPGGPNDIPAPVSFITFRAKPIDEKSVALNWATASEENNDYFSIEHSLNGRDFVELEKVYGAGTTFETQHYQYLHKEAMSGSNYYRLRQVDFDGTYSFSEIEVVVLRDQSELSVQPTLAQQEIQISINDGLIGGGGLEIINWLGQVVRVKNISDKNNFTIDVSDLEKGHYIVRMNSKAGVTASRFIKL